PKTPKPNIKPISLDLPPTPVYPTTSSSESYGGGSWGGGYSYGGYYGGGYYPSTPSKPSLPNIPYIECYNEPYLNSMMIVKLSSNNTRSLSALNYMAKDNSFNISSPLLKDSLNLSTLNNKSLNPLNSLNLNSLNSNFVNLTSSNLNDTTLDNTLNLDSSLNSSSN
ncbi:hypothetical protein, partial [Campylobacter portucalensis]|uniref:hypothetical protein n=1 Tax=Campylobacter portucalensis TaxID=2608384 RepID=UPI001E3CAD79